MKTNTKLIFSIVLMLVQFLANIISGSAQTNVCFTSAFDNTYPVNGGTMPYSMASADFNNDSKLDLVITNLGSSNLSLLLGIGNGKFNVTQPIQVGSQPSGITAADFNGDGNADIAFVDLDTNLFFILLGNGDGSFQQSPGFFSGTRPLSIVSPDLNNDGNPDLVAANHDSNNISVSLGNGDGTFPDAILIPTGINPYSIATGDFNGDGIVDLATANNDGLNFMAGNISVFTGNGSGGFLPRIDYSAGWNPTYVTSADLNNDGKSDLITSNSNSQNISVLMAKPSGGFNTPMNYPIFGIPADIASSDFDGDGFKDLAVVDFQFNNILLFSGSASGSLTWKTNYATGGVPGFMISRDINSDADPDLVMLKPQDDAITLWLGTPGGLIDGIKSNQVGVSPNALVTADFNMDGKKDLATPNYDSDNVSILLANSSGNLNEAINSSAGSNPSSLAVADFSSDGRPDIVVANYSIDKISVMIGNGDGSFGAPTYYNVGLRPQKVLSADFNGDGKMDVAVFNSHDINISVLYGDGTGSLSTGPVITVGPSISDLVSADFNKDGKFDLAVLDWIESNVTLILSSGTGSFVEGPKYSVGTNPSIIIADDMDSDGNTDLVVTGHRYSISIFKGNGTGGMSPRIDYTVDIPYAMTVGDFNHDDKLDIAYNTSLNADLSILLAKPMGGFLPVIASNGDGLGFLTTIDLNNDGLIDLAGIGGGNVIVIQNNTAKITANGPTSFCAGNSVVLSATANGHTYLWNTGGSATRDLLVTTGGSYNVTITNQSGSCSSTSNTIFVSSPPPPPSATPVHPSCNGVNGSIAVSIRNVDDTYSFDNGLTFQASNIKSNLTPGSYNVRIRESNGCTSLPAYVTLQAPIEPAEPHAVFHAYYCPENPGAIIISQQNFGETYSIDSGVTFEPTNFFGGLTPRTYGVLIKSRNGCISPIKFINLISLGPPLPNVSVVQPNCYTSSGSISVALNNADDTYSFDDGATFQSASSRDGLATGIYSVRVRTASGCVSDRVTVEINASLLVPVLPQVTTTQSTCTLSTGSISVAVQRVTDVYSFDNGVTFQQEPLMHDLSPGIYKVVIRNDVGCLSGSSDAVLSDPPIVPTQPVVTLTQPTCDARGSITIAEQIPGERYSFDNGGSFQTSNVKPMEAGTYQVLIKSADGCTSVTTSATIFDVPVVPSIPLVTLTQPTCDLSEGSITVDIQDLNDSYSFDGGITFQSSQIKSGLTPGNYTVLVRRNNECISAGSTVTINQQPSKPITPVITIDNSGLTQPLLISSSGSSCKWFKDGILVPGQISTSLVVTSIGSYFVVAISADGCESEASDPVEITITNIDENSDKVQLYPNPTEDQILLNLFGFTFGKDIDITILNSYGMVVRHLTTIATETTALDVAQLADGEYIVVLKQSEKRAANSFIKK